MSRRVPAVPPGPFDQTRPAAGATERIFPPQSVDAMPTKVIATMPDERRRGSPAARPRRRGLRWRLLLTFGALLAGLLLVLGIVLDVFLGQVLYRTELSAFQNDVKATVATQQRRYDQLVLGRRADGCASAESYQQAFQDAVEMPLTHFHSGVQAAYLLQSDGVVLVASDPRATIGAQGPYLLGHESELRQLRADVLGATQSGTAIGTGYIADVSYMATSAGGQRVGVELVADRYHTASTCISQRTTVGVVEVVTTFPRVHAILSALHVLLLVVLGGALVLGVLVGGPLITRALRPLTRMTETAGRIAGGDLSQRVRLPHTSDEIGQLGNAFDEMIERIQYGFAVQQASEDRMRQFIADASHELRTPLTSIRGYIDVLLRGAKNDPETADEVLRATRRETERMTRLVNDLLTLARFDAGRPLETQPVDLIALAGEAVDQARILAGEREVALRTDGRGRLPIQADPDRLKQVLLILLDNALKYGRPAPDGWVRVFVERTDRGVVLSVADNGPGIAPEDLPHIFDRFYRAERAARTRRMTGRQVADRAHEAPTGQQDASAANHGPSGSGLGLCIAQAIVQAHGGTLSVQSRVGSGTTFTLALPAEPPPL